LTSLQPPETPAQYAVDADQVRRGEQVFAEQDCAQCHSGSAFTNGQLVDVGTSSPAGELYDTPSLRWLWLSAPYFHDGRAATLGDVFSMAGAHYLLDKVRMDDIDALIAYLLTLR
ncbi:MAG: c-type cytochrome, partial [Anaerolineae bacterium]|nr:c-type cytochrome [Anaerolineae bacterium]